MIADSVAFCRGRASGSSSTPSSLLYEGAVPVFCDVDPVTLNLDRDAAAAAVGERTGGILPIHIFGYPANLPALEALASDRGLSLLEDSCRRWARRTRRDAGSEAGIPGTPSPSTPTSR